MNNTQVTTTQAAPIFPPPGVPNPPPLFVNFTLTPPPVLSTSVQDMQAVAVMPPDLRDKAIAMVTQEQEHRHHLEKSYDKNTAELEHKKLNSEFELKQQQIRNIYRSEMTSKVISGIIVLFFLGLLGYLAYTKNYWAFGSLLGATALFAWFFKPFFDTMLQNKNSNR